MALDSNALAGDLEPIFTNYPASKEDCAAQIAQAYFDYASTGQFGASLAVPTNAQRDAMAATIATALTVPGLPVTIAAAFASGLTAFWIAVPVVGAQAGATVGCPGAASLAGSLPALAANLANTAATFAAGLAVALHGATATVTANVAPPPGTVLPIS